jgi:hypothetical protein
MAAALALVAAGFVPACRAETTASCHGLVVTLPFERKALPANEVDELVVTDVRTQFCHFDARKTVVRADDDEPLPVLDLGFAVEAFPRLYRPDPAQQRAVRDYQLHSHLDTYAQWSRLYSISGDWAPPQSHLPWACRSAVTNSVDDKPGGDEYIVCASAQDERLVVLHATVRREARMQRDALITAIGAVRWRDERSDHR